MKTIVKLAVALALVAGFVSTAVADETVTGKLMCAKCSLKKAGQDKCQDVLITTDAAGKTTEYYVEKNDVAKTFGHTCQGEKPASVTGASGKKDCKKWIAATKMEAPKS